MTVTSGKGECRVCGKDCALRWDRGADAFVVRTHGYSTATYLNDNYCAGSGDAPKGKPSLRRLDPGPVDPATVNHMEPTKTRPGDQQLPIPNDAPYVQDQVMAYIERRKQVGISRYGTALQAGNGRDALQDALEEAIDLSMYLAQLIIERDGKLP